MKSLLLLFTILVFTKVTAQRIIEIPEVKINTNNKLPIGLDSGCTSNNISAINTQSQYYYFLLSGINLAKYDWSIPTLNCHINSAYIHKKNERIYAIAAGLTSIIGLSFVYWGLTEKDSPKVTSTNGNISITYENNRNTYLSVGIPLVCASIPLYYFTYKNHKKADFHMRKTMQIINILNKPN